VGVYHRFKVTQIVHVCKFGVNSILVQTKFVIFKVLKDEWKALPDISTSTLDSRVTSEHSLQVAGLAFLRAMASIIVLQEFLYGC
jgi:hypothetical protein